MKGEHGLAQPMRGRYEGVLTGSARLGPVRVRRREEAGPWSGPVRRGGV